MEIEDALDRLDLDIKRLKIDWERFFNGNLPIPPEQLRYNIAGQVQGLRSTHIRSLAHRFRLNNLEAKFNTLSVLFNRRLRQREMGLGPPVRTAAAAAPRYDAQQGIVIDDGSPTDALQALYDRLYADRERPGTDLARFRSYILGQATKIRRKTGCSRVQFRVAVERGRLKLKAKGLPGEQ